MKQFLRSIQVPSWGIIIIAVLLTAAALTADAQQPKKVTQIGTLDLGSGPARADLWNAFHKELRNLGYIEGRNVAIERRWADGKADRLPALAADLFKLKVDVIAAAGSVAALAAARATTTTPVVFMIVAGDPVKIGLVSSFRRPGANVTGGTSLSSELSAKRLELLREIMPRLHRVAVLWEKASPSAEETVREVEAAGRALGIGVQAFGVSSVRELENTFTTMKGADVSAIVVASGAMFFTERRLLADLSLKHRLPAAFSVIEYAETGGLLTYGPDLKDGFRRAAAHVDKILKGTKPADLPVERPTKFELVINRKTAKALGLTIPRSMLLRADQVIE